MPALPFDWSAKEACDTYEETWEISSKEVHYGWLSPGENALQLFSNVPSGSKALDVGCGMGENVLALHEKGLEAYGLDFSRHMVQKARRNLKTGGMESKPAKIAQHIRYCDARSISSEFREKFDVVLSIYSLEFFLIFMNSGKQS